MTQLELLKEIRQDRLKELERLETEIDDLARRIEEMEEKEV